MNNDNLDLEKQSGDVNASEESNKTMYVPDMDVLNYGKGADDADPSLLDQFKVDGDGADETDSHKNDETKKKDKDKTKGNGFIRFIKMIIPRKKDGAKTIIIKSVSIVAALAFISSAVYLSVYFGDLNSQNHVISGARDTYNLNRDNYTYNDDGQFSKFDTLKAQNSDIVGWISIKGTDVDNPVYQTSDNDYYITHDMNREVNSYGALFLDYRCDIDRLSLTQNQIIYGHNMRYGAMFGTLRNYRDIEYYKKNPVINFDSLYESMQYKIFAIMIVNTSTDDTFGYEFSAYRSEFSSQEDFLLWTEYCKARSLVDTTVDIQPCDEVITLSTCCYDFTDARFVIVGRRVREGESSDVDVESATVNSDVIYSKEYYEKKRIPIPEVEAPTISVYESTK